MSLTLYRKWRPTRWEQVVGQQHVIQTLRNAVAGERVSHALLFGGPRGTGKTTTARLLAKALNCLAEEPKNRPCDQCDHCIAISQGRFLDMIEIDAASNTSVEDVRDLREKINFSPNLGRYKIYIIDEVHMLSTAAFNALLKTLEEPPPHAVFVLATTEMHKIPATVLSRCQRHEFRRIPVPDLVEQLKMIVSEEKLQAEPQALTLIARQSTGSMRDAISLLDHLASAGEEITLKSAEQVLGTIASQSVIDLVNSIISGNVALGLEGLHKTLDAGSEPRLFARQVVDYLRNILLVKMGTSDYIDVTPEIRNQIAWHAQEMPISRLLETIRVFVEAGNDIRSAWQPALPLEMAYIQAVTSPEIDAIISSSNVQVGENPNLHTDKEAVNQAKTSQIIDAQITKEEMIGAQSEDLDAKTSVNLKSVNDVWRKLLSQIRQHDAHIYALLNSGKPCGVKGNVIYLGFKSDFARSKLEQSEKLTKVEDVFSQLLGEAVKLRCFIITGQQGDLPPDVESDGMVAAAIRDLGGEIVDIQ